MASAADVQERTGCHVSDGWKLTVSLLVSQIAGVQQSSFAGDRTLCEEVCPLLHQLDVPVVSNECTVVLRIVNSVRECQGGMSRKC